MGNFSKSKQPGSLSPLIRAIAYYRQSTQSRQEELLAKQQAQVRRWATENGVEIIREFCDARPAPAAGVETEDVLEIGSLFDPVFQHFSKCRTVSGVDWPSYFTSKPRTKKNQ